MEGLVILICVLLVIQTTLCIGTNVLSSTSSSSKPKTSPNNIRQVHQKGVRLQKEYQENHVDHSKLDDNPNSNLTDLSLIENGDTFATENLAEIDKSYNLPGIGGNNNNGNDISKIPSDMKPVNYSDFAFPTETIHMPEVTVTSLHNPTIIINESALTQAQPAHGVHKLLDISGNLNIKLQANLNKFRQGLYERLPLHNLFRRFKNKLQADVNTQVIINSGNSGQWDAPPPASLLQTIHERKRQKLSEHNPNVCYNFHINPPLKHLNQQQ